tara:strand:- start:1928 stop:2197 length:270 start_codon:yes stop_codon:yes gene_type:complete
MNFSNSSRNIYLKNEVLFVSLSLLIDSNFSKKILKEKLILKNFKNLNVNQNQCLITNQKYSIIKKFRLSRISFRNYLAFNFIPGLRRSM